MLMQWFTQELPGRCNALDSLGLLGEDIHIGDWRFTFCLY
jgi:hypothetical protein